MSALVITGAGGYLGRHLVTAARAAGHPVRAMIRSAPPAAWQDDPEIAVWNHDLAQGAPDSALFDGALAVIHAAAGSGDGAAHARDTLAATDALISGLGADARLVLVSSFSVYAVAALPDGATLDETSPVDRAPVRRDAYAQAKIAQELRAIRVAQHGGLDLRIARPGAIYGNGVDWTARLGWRRGKRVLCPGGSATVPAIHVEDCARRLVALALAEGGPADDLPVLSGGGRIRVVNLVSSDPPRQSDWIAARGLRAIRVPRKPLMRLASIADLGADLLPSIDRRLPTGLREATLAARFKPLRYSTARADDWLGADTEARPFRLDTDLGV